MFFIVVALSRAVRCVLHLALPVYDSLAKITIAILSSRTKVSVVKDLAFRIWICHMSLATKTSDLIQPSSDHYGLLLNTNSFPPCSKISSTGNFFEMMEVGNHFLFSGTTIINPSVSPITVKLGAGFCFS